jgi:hypothetical protein
MAGPAHPLSRLQNVTGGGLRSPPLECYTKRVLNQKQCKFYIRLKSVEKFHTFGQKQPKIDFYGRSYGYMALMKDEFIQAQSGSLDPRRPVPFK